MDIKEAAKVTRREIMRYDRALEATRSEKGDGLEHAAWLLEGIAGGYIENEKAHRWLGYAQAICVIEGIRSLDDVKKINLAA